MRRPPDLSQLAYFPVTGGVILLSIVVSCAYWMGTDISPLVEDGNVRRGELWRCVSSALPHVNFLHLAFNAYWLWVFGSLVEEVFGHLKAGLIYVLFAFGSGTADYAFSHGGVGLSGVGYGLWCMLWILSTRDRRFEGAVDSRTSWMFIAWFFLCIATSITGTLPVANVAHGVGALLGAILGWAIVAHSRQKFLAVASFVLVLIASALGATLARPWINFASDAAHGEFELGYQALEDDRDEDAVRWFRDVVRMSPNDPGGWFNLGIAYQRLGRLPEAINAFETAHHLQPENEKYRDAWQSLVNPPKSAGLVKSLLMELFRLSN